MATAGIRKLSLFVLSAGLLILPSVSLVGSAQASPRKVGDRVEAEWKSGLWYTARIIAIDSWQFKVRYESNGIMQDLMLNVTKPRRAGGLSSPM